MGRRRFDRDRRFLSSGAAGGGVVIPRFTPPAVTGANLQVWLEPSDGASSFNTIVSGAFSSLGNKGAFGGAWAQSTGARRPTVGTINTRTSVTYVRVNGHYLVGPPVGAAFPSGSHMFVVILSESDPPASASLPPWKWESNTVGLNFYPNPDSNVYDGWGATARKSTGNPTQNLTVAHIYSVVSIAGEWTAKRGNVQDFTTGVNTPGWDPTLTILGGGSTTLGTDPPTNTFGGGMGSLLVYDAKLSVGDELSVYNSLKAWWGTP